MHSTEEVSRKHACTDGLPCSKVHTFPSSINPALARRQRNKQQNQGGAWIIRDGSWKLALEGEFQWLYESQRGKGEIGHYRLCGSTMGSVGALWELWEYYGQRGSTMGSVGTLCILWERTMYTVGALWTMWEYYGQCRSTMNKAGALWAMTGRQEGSFQGVLEGGCA